MALKRLQHAPIGVGSAQELTVQAPEIVELLSSSSDVEQDADEQHVEGEEAEQVEAEGDAALAKRLQAEFNAEASGG